MKKNFLIVFFLMCSVFGQSYFRVTTMYKKTYVYLDDIVKYYFGSVSSLTEKQAKLNFRGKKMTVIADKGFVILDGIKVFLSHPVATRNNQLFISKTDVVSLLDSLLRTVKVAPRSKLQTIIIDAGHGGRDSGGQGSRVKEKDFNLRLSKMLKKALEKRRYKVFLTRKTDKYISLEKRVKFAKQCRADLFVSIHANTSSSSASANGIEAYQLVTYKGMSSSGKRKNQREYAHKFSRQNAKVAYEIQRQLINVTKRQDRGVRYQNFLVLRQATFPAVLLELGFLSNFSEETQLMSQNEQELIVWSIVNGIVAYHNSL